eukprot:5184775-Amphidinium_carterae.2
MMSDIIGINSVKVVRHSVRWGENLAILKESLIQDNTMFHLRSDSMLVPHSVPHITGIQPVLGWLYRYAPDARRVVRCGISPQAAPTCTAPSCPSPNQRDITTI